MTAPRKKSEEIRQYILTNIEKHPHVITRMAAEHFNITQPAISRHMQNLVKEGLVRAEGNTKARKYTLETLVDEVFQVPVANLQEDIEWEKRIHPLLKGISDNVRSICLYGFTEMLNNVIDHSGSKDVVIFFRENAVKIEMSIWDSGIGIFNKIQRAFNLDDPRHALLELSKGKLTTDKDNHSGEGIFFTSRMFDTFSIQSDSLYFARLNQNDDWLIEVEDRHKTPGTRVQMEISMFSERTVQQVYAKYTAEKDDFGFTKTHVPIQLLKYEGEELVSRSQAKRLLARFENFKEVFLDFRGITRIGQAFADEVFRVYRKAHPEVQIIWVHTTDEVEKMIAHVLANEDDNLKQISLF